jgi:hypothetical protein
MSSNPAGPPPPRAKERGLASLNEARLVRRRSIVFGRVRLREVATRFWLLTFAGMVLFGIIYYRHAQNELTAKRNQLAARQRAVASAAGSGGLALRDKLEAWVLALADAPPEPLIAPQASLDEIARGPGVYLRSRLIAAHASDSLRSAAAQSLHDGFTSCLFIGRAPEPSAGVACKSKSQCGPGELCDDWGFCAVPGQPYNLRLLYDALKVQGPEWDQRLASASDELQVRAMELELEDTAKHEVPAAAELIKRSKYFTAVLDEEPAPGSSDLPADAGVEESEQERLQATDHFVRVGIWDIGRAEQLLRMRVPLAGRFIELGQQRTTPGPDALRARQRQANNCAAAVEVREALLARSGTPVAASGADTPVPKPSE